MKAPRKLKEDVSKNFPYLFLEKNHHKDKFENAYERKPRIAISGTEHRILTDKNKIIQRKRASKPKNPLFRIPYQEGENPRGIDGKFIQTDRTKIRQHYSGAYRNMQYTDTGRKY